MPDKPPTLIIPRFCEDDFEQKTASAKTQKVKRARRQIMLGKFAIFLISLMVVFILYYAITVLITGSGYSFLNF